MTQRITPIERAFALARSGRYENPSGIRQQLQVEGLDSYQLEGPLLLKQLRALCKNARNHRP